MRRCKDGLVAFGIVIGTCSRPWTAGLVAACAVFCVGERVGRAGAVARTISVGRTTTSPTWAFTACIALLGGCISPSRDNHQLESRMRETRQSGSEGGGANVALPTPIHRPSL